MHTVMDPKQVKTMKIQAGIQVSRPRVLRRQLQLWKRFGRLHLIVFVLVRNIVKMTMNGWKRILRIVFVSLNGEVKSHFMKTRNGSDNLERNSHLYGLPRLMGQLGLRLPMAQAVMIVMLLAANNQCTNKTLFCLLLDLSLLPSSVLDSREK
nr:hypothetical protein [Tanacetum cinerariifolium]